MQARSIRELGRTARGRGALIASVALLGWSLVEMVNLAVVHNTGPELYGVLAAVLAVVAAAANLVLLRSSRTPGPAVVAVVALWGLIALAGVAGTIAHIVGPVAGHGPVDLRPRPVMAPLVFTLFGAVGVTTLVLGLRTRGHASSSLGE